MAWSKDAENTTTYLDFGLVPVSGTAARTTVVKFKTSHGSGIFRMGGWGSSPTNGERWGWRLDGTASFGFRCEVNGGFFRGDTTTGLNDGVWHTAVFGVPAGDDLTNAVMHIDGVKQTLAKTTRTVNTSSANPVAIGRDNGLAADIGPNAEHAETAVYNRLLNDAEQASISSGFSPLLIPRGLVVYSPLVRELRDLLGATITENGGANASISNHPRVIYPSAPIIGIPVAAVAADVLMPQVWM